MELCRQREIRDRQCQRKCGLHGIFAERALGTEPCRLQNQESSDSSGYLFIQRHPHGLKGAALKGNVEGPQEAD